MSSRHWTVRLTSLALFLTLFSATVAFGQAPLGHPSKYTPPEFASGGLVVFPRNALVQRTYAVSDLVAVNDYHDSGQRGAKKKTPEQLLQLIRTTVSPDSWSKLGVWDLAGVGFEVQDAHVDVAQSNILQFIPYDRNTLALSCFPEGQFTLVEPSSEKPLPAGGISPMDFGDPTPSRDFFPRPTPSPFPGDDNFYKYATLEPIPRIPTLNNYPNLVDKMCPLLLREDDLNSDHDPFAPSLPSTNELLPATLRYDPYSRCLVVRQTEQRHVEISEFLAALRQQRQQKLAAARKQKAQETSELLAALRCDQELEVAVELCVVQISNHALKKSGLKFGGQPILWNDDQVRQFRRTTQGDRFTSVMQAPKLTVRNAQGARIRVGNAESFLTGLEVVPVANRVEIRQRHQVVETGLDCKVCPVVSADQRFVHLDLDFLYTHVNRTTPALPVVWTKPGQEEQEQHIATEYQVQQPQVLPCKVERLLKIGDGQTAVLLASPVTLFFSDDKTHALRLRGETVKVFDKAKNCWRKCSVIVLVTSHIVLHEEEEQEALDHGTLPPLPRR